ncbi:MAG TPA: hypothetical protein DCZ95_16880 [Verrucomicrobia bacterium]|nr:MAG: hypothetical protein A2X46_09370 [Lentisphaerae bacterium GWF2_57_35]HBA85759.1 hypothetical protein [Verrucomicrobiota bacterium]
MANYFHLVLETPDGNCGKFMQSLTTAYTVYFNLRHQRHGHLVDGRYKAKVVEGGLAEDDEDLKVALKASPCCIGSEAFRAWVDERYSDLVEKHKRREDVSFRKTFRPLTPEVVLKELSETFGVSVKEFTQRRRESTLRGVGARFLCQYAAMTQREAADVLGVGSGAAISHQMRKLAARIERDKKLNRLVREARARLEVQRRGER